MVLKVNNKGECTTHIHCADISALISTNKIDMEKIAENLDYVVYEFHKNKGRQ